MPTGVEPLTITLRDVCFLHWPVPEAQVAELLPDWLTPNTTDGSAWISAIPMEMARFDVFGVPVREGIRAVNLRTYVESPDGNRGVYFLSLDVTDRLAAETARRLFRLPYYAADIDRSSDGEETTIRSARLDDSGATLDVTYEPTGATQAASPDTLASFLAERYRYFTEGPLGTRLVGSVGHEPWGLQSAKASVTDATLVAAVAGREPGDQPLAHYSDGTSMTIGPPRPLSMERRERI